jgi:TonB-dependent Receptor Plug Domain
VPWPVYMDWNRYLPIWLSV